MMQHVNYYSRITGHNLLSLINPLTNELMDYLTLGQPQSMFICPTDVHSSSKVRSPNSLLNTSHRNHYAILKWRHNFAHDDSMMMIAFITIKSSLVPLIEGLCAQIYFRFQISVVLLTSSSILFCEGRNVLKENKKAVSADFYL